MIDRLLCALCDSMVSDDVYLIRNSELGFKLTLRSPTNSFRISNIQPRVRSRRMVTQHIWPSTTAKPVINLKGHAGGVRALAFSPDRGLLAVASVDGPTRLWD